MQKLIQGVHHFHDNIFSTKKRFYERLVDGQRPLALFITCSDSRICPNLLTQTEPGELFILRNAGNIIPAFGAERGGEAATIEYAVSVLGVHDIIICGHSHCGAMGALLQPPSSLEDLPAVQDWLRHAAATRRIVKENYSHIEGERARLMITVEENVLVQLENLRTHPCVASALAGGRLTLHGWVYKLDSGEVFAYDVEHGQFLPMADIGPTQEARAEVQAAI